MNTTGLTRASVLALCLAYGLPLMAADRMTTAACPTQKPGPINGLEWTCVNGGWIPGTQPTAPPDEPPTVPDPRAARVSFRVGHTYQRDASGGVLHIAGIVQLSNGVHAFAAECMNAVSNDQCFFPGEGRFILAGASSLGWTDITER